MLLLLFPPRRIPPPVEGELPPVKPTPKASRPFHEESRGVSGE